MNQRMYGGTPTHYERQSNPNWPYNPYRLGNFTPSIRYPMEGPRVWDILDRWAGNTPTQAPGLPAISLAVDLLSEQMARAPLRVCEKDVNEQWHSVGAHPITDLLRKPSREYNPFTFWRHAFRVHVATGNAYLAIGRDGEGQPSALRVADLHPRWVVTRDGNDREIVYSKHLKPVSFPDHAQEDDVLAKDVLAIHSSAFNGLFSLSPITAEALMEARLVRAVLERQKRNFETGLDLSQVMTQQRRQQGEMGMSQGEMERFLQEVERQVHEGMDRPMSLPPGWDLKNVPLMAAQDMQLIEMLRFTIEDIARIFNVPLPLLHHFHTGMRIAPEMEPQATRFEKWTLGARMDNVAAESTFKLLSGEDHRNMLEVKPDYNAVSLGSLTERLEIAGKGYADYGLMEQNESRGLIGLKPIEGGDKTLDAPKGAGAPKDEGSKSSGDDDEDMDED